MSDTSSILTRLEATILGDSTLDVTERRRKLFVALGVAVAIPFIFVMDIANFSLLSNFEIFIDTFAIVLLVANLVLIRILPTGIWLYRVDALFFGFLALFYLTEDLGDGTAVMWSFAYPIVFIFLLGRREGAIWTCVFCLCTVVLFLTSPTNFAPSFPLAFLATFLFISLLAFTVETLRELFERESRALIEQLETALSEVKTLKRLLPICANCKKIRDDRGYWNQIESYLKEHADTSFTHSVCPDCMEELYPEFVERYMKNSAPPGEGESD
ncbi:MAG: hypothetical protein LJE93_12875 [Acidobacteria bacterium]|jgi:hypothetical protein|nr:hypothetical protein [Acidobacteriota bacterium]